LMIEERVVRVGNGTLPGLRTDQVGWRAGFPRPVQRHRIT
jgi:hypothetical protein